MKISFKNGVSAVLLLHLFAAGSSLADECRRPDEATRGRARLPSCRPTEPVRPYEPDRVRAGRNPGFIDLGNGAQVKVDGSVRFDGDLRRR